VCVYLVLRGRHLELHEAVEILDVTLGRLQGERIDARFILGAGHRRC
jgi:hypothetical protein